MLITDFEIFTSDDPTDGYKELHDFAQANGYDKGWHYNHKGVHYYLCRRKTAVKRALRFYQARIVSRSVMKRIVHKSYDRGFPRDYKIYSIKRRCAHMLKEVCEASGISIPQREVEIKSGSTHCRARYWDIDISVTMFINDKCPNGRVVFKSASSERELPVPESVVEKINLLNRPIPVGKTIKLV